MKDIQADIYETIPHPHNKWMEAKFGLFPNKFLPDQPNFPWRSAREFNWAIRLDGVRLGFGVTEWPQFVEWINGIDAGLKERGLVR
jgi:hypothetical protein